MADVLDVCVDDFRRRIATEEKKNQFNFADDCVERQQLKDKSYKKKSSITLLIVNDL
jgi:hypothetical protein